MNHYLKHFLHRGLLFAGFGPIVLGIVYLILSGTVPSFSLDGKQTFIAILSTYLLAFLQAGATVFNQIERWPIAKSLLCHFSLLYAAYVGCYLLNAWIPFVPSVLLVFTAIFVASYFLIWGVVYLSVKIASKKFNDRLK